MKIAQLLLLIMLLEVETALAGEIALTFDDAPTPTTAVMSGEDRTVRLLRELKAANVEQALFFVTTHHINADSADRLRAYAAAGHLLGNHSHAHLSANEIAPDDFLVDAYKAHLTLKAFDNVMPMFRFPYLHQGKDSASRRVIAKGLSDLGYSIGYVSVDNFDWYLDSRYREAVAAGKSVNLDKLRDLYVDIIWSTIKFYDEIAKQALGRSPKHILLLHENDLAATFLGDLVKRIKAEGWAIITPTAAYADPLLHTAQDLEFTKQGRVAALAHRKGVPVEQLRHPSENTDYLDHRISQLKIIGL